MRSSLLLFKILGITTSLIVNLRNINVIKKANPANKIINTQSINNNWAVWSIDNEYYLTPPENFIKGLGWKRAPAVGNGSYFRRTPGYSILYYVSMKICGEKNGILAIVIFQNILFLLSIYCVFVIGNYIFSGKNYIKGLFSLMYTTLPFFYSYNFFTLTESVSLFFSIFSFFFLIKALTSNKVKTKWLFYVLASIFIGYNTLTRPFSGLIFIALPYFIFIDNEILGIKHKFNTLAICLAFFLLPILIWTYRNYKVSGEIVVLEKYMHPQSLDRTKPEFSAFWRLTQCWGEDGGIFNSYFMPFFDTIMAGKSGDTQMKDIIERMNPKLWDVVSKEEFSASLDKYSEILIIQKPYYDKQVAMPKKYFPLEYELVKELGGYRERYISANKLQHYILTPIKYYKDLMLNSYSAHMFIFQAQNISGNNILKLFKGLMVFIYILMHLSAIFCFFGFVYKLYSRKEMSNEQKIVGFVSVLSLLFTTVLIFLFRAIEQRYFHPYLIFILVTFVVFFSAVFEFLKLKFKRA